MNVQENILLSNVQREGRAMSLAASEGLRVQLLPPRSGAFWKTASFWWEPYLADPGPGSPQS